LDDPSLKVVADLLQVSEDSLRKSLISRKFVTGRESYTKPINKDQVRFLIISANAKERKFNKQPVIKYVPLCLMKHFVFGVVPGNLFPRLAIEVYVRASVRLDRASDK
jgi:hypothetical protein